MIEASEFVESASRLGFKWYAGVPCSFLTPFINYVLQDSALHYVSMANEGDAVALIAGVALTAAGNGAPLRGITMMQNSGLGNAVSPLTSLTWTFKLPQLLIVTWRGQPGITDEPQHALMGPITPQLLDTMEIPWELFPTEPAAIAPALARAVSHMDMTGRPYALLMQKGSVANTTLKRPAAQAKLSHCTALIESSADFTARPSRQQALREVITHTQSGAAIFASTGYCGRELYAIEDRANHLYMVGSMGCVVPLALGFALARPGVQVIALDGDGAALMRMGALATVGAYSPPNFWHLLLDNGVHDSTGGQATVSPQISFAEVAAACGYLDAMESEDVARLASWLRAVKPGPHFARLLIRPGTPDNLPRPAVSPIDVKERFMRHFSLSVH